MGELSPWHLLILAAVFVLLFGAKKLPDAARSVGKSLRIFKTEMKGLHDDESASSTAAGQLPPAAPAAPPASPAPTTTASPAEHVEPASAAGDRPDPR